MKNLPLSNTAKCALVDDDVFDEVSRWTWHLNKLGYVERRHRENGRQSQVLLHRYVSSCPKGMLTDHVSGVRTDCRRENLRICTPEGNARNVARPKNNTSGYKGVTWNRINGKWTAQIAPNWRNVILGYFDDPVQAAKVYNVASIWFFGEFARLNDVDGDRREWLALWIESDRNLTRRPNTSGYRGVSWSAERKLWEAYITRGTKRRHLGRFDHKVAAALEYNAAAASLHGDQARLNPINDVDRADYETWLASQSGLHLSRSNTSGFLGVTAGYADEKWNATVAGSYVGTYDSKEEAAYVVDQVRMQLLPGDTRFNVIDKEGITV